MGSSKAGSASTAMTTSITSRVRRLAGVLIVAGGCTASLVILPTTAQAQQGTKAAVGATTRPQASHSLPLSAASTFCAHFSATKVSSIVGAKVALFEAIPEKTSLECIFEGAREVVISREPVPASDLSTLAKAEARFKAESPKGVKIAFTALPSLGPTAFSWSYVENGGLLVGVGNNKGNMAWGAVVGASVKIMGAPASHVTAVEHLVELDMAA